jgi:hypothetical protein
VVLVHTQVQRGEVNVCHAPPVVTRIKMSPLHVHRYVWTICNSFPPLAIGCDVMVIYDVYNSVQLVVLNPQFNPQHVIHVMQDIIPIHLVKHHAFFVIVVPINQVHPMAYVIHVMLDHLV